MGAGGESGYRPSACRQIQDQNACCASDCIWMPACPMASFPGACVSFEDDCLEADFECPPGTHCYVQRQAHEGACQWGIDGPLTFFGVCLPE